MNGESDELSVGRNSLFVIVVLSTLPVRNPEDIRHSEYDTFFSANLSEKSYVGP